MQFRISHRYEHLGEPAQESRSFFNHNTNFQVRTKESDDLRKQISSIQASLSAVAARLDIQNVGPSP